MRCSFLNNIFGKNRTRRHAGRQRKPTDGSGATAAVVIADATRRGPITLHDLQRGFAQWQSGATNDAAVRNGFLWLLAAVLALCALAYLLSYLKRRRAADSLPRLDRELCRALRLNLRSRLALRHLSRFSNTPVAVLLISPACLQRQLERWRESGEPKRRRKSVAAGLGVLAEKLTKSA